MICPREAKVKRIKGPKARGLLKERFKMSKGSQRGPRELITGLRGGILNRDLSECRVAILGGDARQENRWDGFKEALFFMARRDGGNGELRRLVATLRAKSIDLMIILARWNSHSATSQIQRLCRTLGVRVVVVR